MKNEIRLFILTKLLITLYGSQIRAMRELKKVLGDFDVLDLWRERFIQIDESKELQIMLMREAGITYRKIEQLLKVSQATISRVVKSYELNYQPLPGIEALTPSLLGIDEQMKEEGFEIW